MNNKVNKITSKTQLININEIYQYKNCLAYLIKKNLFVKYNQTFFGYLWILLQPLAQMILLTFFFNRVMRLDSGNLPYALFVLCGIIVIRFFSNSVMSASSSIARSSSLVKQIYIPKIFLPLSGTVEAIFPYLVGLLMIITLSFYYSVPFTFKYLYLIPLMIYLGFISFGFSLIFSSLNLQFKDINQALPVFLQFMLYLSPVVYMANMVPDFIYQYYIYNPFVGSILFFRWCIEPNGIFPLLEIIASLKTSLLIFVFGFFLFQKRQNNFADYI